MSSSNAFEPPDFKSLNLNIHEYIKNYPIEMQIDIFNYLNEMDEINRKAYEIAYSHLGSSFNVVRSNGYNNWKSK